MNRAPFWQRAALLSLPIFAVIAAVGVFYGYHTPPQAVAQRNLALRMVSRQSDELAQLRRQLMECDAEVGKGKLRP